MARGVEQVVAPSLVASSKTSMSNIPQTGTPSQAQLATTLVSSAAITGASFGLGRPTRFNTVVDVATQGSSKHPIASRRIIYGTRGQLGGTLTYVTTSPTTSTQHALGIPVSNNGNIHMVWTFAGHEIDGFLGGRLADVNATEADVPLVIYLDGYAVPLTLNGAPAFGGDSSSYVDIGGISIPFSLAPTDGAYYVPTDYVPPKVGGKTDKAHDFRWRIRVEVHNGDPTDTSQPFPLLASDVSGNPGNWTSACLQRGCAKAHVQLIWDKDRFNNGLPNIGFSIAGKKVWDPRLSPPGFAYSENAALCAYDFMTDTKFGLRINPSLIDQDLFIAAANKCDEAMALREGGTQPRYACNGVVEANVKRGEVLQKLLDSMAGTLVPPGSVWKMYAGGYSDPVMTITDADLRGPIKIDTAVSRKDLANGAKGTFISPDNQWQAADYPPFVNAGYVEADGGTVTIVDGHPTYTGVVFTDFSLDFVSDSVQAQRLAKIKIEKIRHNCPLVLQCNLKAFPLEVNDTISFTHERWGLSAATYVVTNTALVRDDKTDAPTLGVDLVLVPATAEDYAWDPDVDEGTVTIVTAPFLPDNSNVGAPTGVGSPPVLGLESDSSTTIVRADGIAHSQIKVTWTPPTDHLVLNGGYIEIFIKKVSDPDSDYFLDGSVNGDASVYFISKNITDGIDYDLKIQSLNAAGSHSEPLSGSIVCSGSASSIVATGGAGPVGVNNNDFEASDTLPPVSWTVKGTPTLDYEISSQQQGLRSLKVTSSTQYEGVYTSSKYAVVPGDTYTGESWKVGGYIKGDGTGHGAIVFRFFDATDTEVGTPVLADGGSPTPADWNFYSAVGLAPNEAVYARVFLQNLTTTGTSNLLEFDSIVLFRVASLEDEIANGPSRGAITAANTSYRPLTNPLTAHDDGASTEIDIASFTMRSSLGPVDMSIHSGSITGLGYNTTYHVYYDDPMYAGGVVIFYCNTDQAVALDASGRFYIGSITTPTPGGVDTVGNNDGGTGAQSGQLYWLSPTLRADFDTAAGAVLWSPAFAEDTDGDTGGTPVEVTVPDTIWLGGIPTIYSKWKSLKLKMVSEVVSIDNGGIAFADYSLDDGASWTNIFNVANGSQDVEQPSTAANSGSGTAWTNPANLADPTDYATITGLAHGLTSKADQATGFDFSGVPALSFIDGIIVNFDEKCGGSAFVAGEVPQFKIQLLKSGTPVGVAKLVNAQDTTTISQGDDLDLWGTTWAVSDLADIGVQVSAVTPTAPGSWAAGTYYSPLAIIIDSNGNVQQVVTGGVSGTTHPTWATTLSATTADGTGSLEWVMLQSHTTTTWSSGHDITGSGWRGTGDPTNPADTGHFIVPTAAGTPCVFELTPGRMPRLGNVEAYIFSTNSGQKGSCNLAYPAGNPPAAAIQTFAPVSLHWTSNYTTGAYEFYQFAINGDGSLGGGIDVGRAENWQCAIVGQMFFPKKGVYNFNMQHDDGTVIAFDPIKCKVTSCPRGIGNVYMGPRAPVTGYNWMAGSNASTTYSTGYDSYSIPPGPYSPYDVWNEFFSISVNEDNSTIGFEINFTNWEHKGHMILLCQDAAGTYRDIVPVSTNLHTGASTPTWPAWSTASKPSWPMVTESSGNLVWVNRGPATDFVWHATTEFTEAGVQIIDSNGYGQKAYEAGVSAAVSAPAFSTTTNNLTSDGTGSLKWINDGVRDALTYFDFSIRNAVMSISYVPPTAVSSRAKTTDEITLPLTQNLGKVQVRYGLDLQDGTFDMYEVWVEAQAG